jgi:hypothetical protein
MNAAANIARHFPTRYQQDIFRSVRALRINAAPTNHKHLRRCFLSPFRSANRAFGGRPYTELLSITSPSNSDESSFFYAWSLRPMNLLMPIPSHERPTSRSSSGNQHEIYFGQQYVLIKGFS